MPVVRFDGTFPDVDYGPSLDSIQFGHAVYGNVTTNTQIVQDLVPMR